ncbi:hypothetical protein [Actinokineospora sp.]|uniref:hypothetical protein n=1 Tax=Actinokineospora sp. TaxID=1872133 RepID=UPI003D6A6813
MGGVAAHVAWVSTTSRGRQPHCVQVTATGPGGSAERAFIKSGGQHILALCEGGIFPQFDTQAARKALAGHTRQLMARRARDDN